MRRSTSEGTPAESSAAAVARVGGRAAIALQALPAAASSASWLLRLRDTAWQVAGF